MCKSWNVMTVLVRMRCTHPGWECVNGRVCLDALGLADKGKAHELVANGDITFGGKYLINPSGGLISKGHPIGATGLAQASELVTSRISSHILSKILPLTPVTTTYPLLIIPFLDFLYLPIVLS